MKYILVLVLLCVPTVIAVCTDTDGGLNYFVQGTASSWYQDGETDAQTDSCSGSQLREAICTTVDRTDRVSSVIYTCSYGCFAGACLPAPTYQCGDGIDNDGDGDVDMDDGGCASASDNDESNCGDGVCEGGEIVADCNEDCNCTARSGFCCEVGMTCEANLISDTECTSCCDTECVECIPETEICDDIDHDCDGDPLNGFDLISDDSNCGECGIECSDTQSCIESVCEDCTDEICDGFDNDCDGTPDNGFNFDNDAQNCGDCDVVCPGICSNGECVYHDADEDDSGDISIIELSSYLEEWIDGQISIIEFLDAASVWKE